VPFIHKPEKPDRELEQKLLYEAPGILRWMIDGCLDWQQNGLVRPQSVVDATKEYFSDQDLFTHWLDEECICEPHNVDRSAPSSALFKSWTDYARAAGVRPGTTSNFKDRMLVAGFKCYRSNKAREFFGVSLQPSFGDDSSSYQGWRP
jgi:putative DNA primase/helicase